MNVYKFGGSCLTGTDSFERIGELIEAAGTPVACVFSAFKGVTDRLIGLANGALRGGADAGPLLEEHHALLASVNGSRRARAEAVLADLGEELRRALKGIEYLGEVSPRSLDRLMSLGERTAVVVAEALLGDAGLPVCGGPDADPGFVTDGVHGDARITSASVAELRARYGGRDAVYLIPGFVGRSEEGEITTFGRGGSDYSATFLGAALGATTTLWKDTPGLLTSDPLLVPTARIIPRLHYLDALELAHYGTEAIADKAILPAMEAGTPVEIRSFLDPSICTRVNGSDVKALAITCVHRAAMVEFLGHGGDMLRTLSRLYQLLADTHVYPLLLTEASPRGETSMVIKESDLPRIERRLRDGSLGEAPQIQRNLGVVSLIGSHMVGRVGMAAGIFECLAAHGINIVAIAQTASERNVSVAVIRDAVDEAVRALHARFIDAAG